MKRLTISFLTFLVIIGGSIFVSTYINEDTHTVAVSRTNEYRMSGMNDKESFINTPTEFTEDILIDLTDQYLKLITQEIDKDYRLVHITTLDELYKLFDGVATRDVSEQHISYYFSEMREGVYLRPTELPPWFDKNTPYDMTQVSDQQVNVNQTVTRYELYGPYHIQFEFHYTDQWRISEVTTKSI